MNLQDVAANNLKASQTHQERHVFLHKCFDELLADFIYHTKNMLTDTNLMDFMRWSHSQTLKPTEKEEDNNEHTEETNNKVENDTLEEKFRSFLEGLEMMHIDEFLEESPTKLKMIGIEMSIRVRKLQKYKKAFEAAKAFIDSHVADPDITTKMVDRYLKYKATLEELEI